MTEWRKWLGTFPFFAIIIGDIGQGKTGTAASIIEEYRHEVVPYMVAIDKVHERYPEWMERIPPNNIKIPNNAIMYIDDAHLYYNARDWATNWAAGNTKFLGQLARERRQVNTGIIVTTQDATVIDKNLLPMISAIIIKKPSRMQRKYERSEIRKDLEIAHKELKGLGKEWAYIVSDADDYEGLIEVDLPNWFDDRISNAHEDYFGTTKIRETQSKTLLNGLGLINKIGKAFK